MALFDETRFSFALDSAPKLPSTTPALKGDKKPGGSSHAAKYPGSYGNPECFSKKPEGCWKHKTGKFAAPGSPFSAKGATASASPKPPADKKAPSAKPPKKGYGAKSGGDAIQKLIDAEKNPEVKAKMQKYYNDFLAKQKIKSAIAQQQSAAKPAPAPEPSPAPSQQSPSKPIPASGDYDGWQSLYAEIRDENKAKIDADFQSGRITKEQWADLHSAEDAKFASKVAKLEKPKPAQPSGEGSAASAPAETPKPQPPKVVGSVPDSQKGEIDSLVSRVNKAFSDAGIASSVSEVRTNPFDTQCVFSHSGAITSKELADFRAKYGSASLKPKLIAPDLYSLTVPNAKVADVPFNDVTSEEGVAESASKMSAPCVLGRGRSGRAVVRDVADMHHILIGGKTGEGKSSVLNSILVGAMKFKSPEDLELYLVDPQKVEFDAYRDMPHVSRSASGSEPSDVATVVDMLDDCLAEMKHRTAFFSSLESQGAVVKNLKDYREVLAGKPILPHNY